MKVLTEFPPTMEYLIPVSEPEREAFTVNTVELSEASSGRDLE